MALINCPECGKEGVSDSAKMCPNCGFPINKNDNTQVEITQSEGATQSIAMQGKKNNKIIGIIMCIIACICFVVAISNITSDDYNLYLEHYEDCLEGYEECIYKAIVESGYLRSSYQILADNYKDMCDADMVEIWKFRGAAIICGVGGVVLVIIGAKKIKEGNK